MATYEIIEVPGAGRGTLIYPIRLDDGPFDARNVGEGLIIVNDQHEVVDFKPPDLPIHRFDRASVANNTLIIE